MIMFREKTTSLCYIVILYFLAFNNMWKLHRSSINRNFTIYDLYDYRLNSKVPLWIRIGIYYQATSDFIGILLSCLVNEVMVLSAYW